MPIKCDFEVTFRDYDGSLASARCGGIAEFQVTWEDAIERGYCEATGEVYETTRRTLCQDCAAELAAEVDGDRVPDPITDVHFWTLAGDEISVLYEEIQARRGAREAL